MAPRLLSIAAVAFLLFLAACCPKPQPTHDRGGIITLTSVGAGPDTMMQFITGPDTMGTAPETLWVTRVDCTLTIKFTGLPAGPDTMMAGKNLRVIARRLAPSPNIQH